MKEVQSRYVCSECGHVETKWMGRCNKCGSWNSFEEETVIPESKPANGVAPVVMDSGIKKLSDIPADKAMRLSSGYDELDRVLGGGVMVPSSVLVGGDPGIGKSTLMLEMIAHLSAQGDVLYVSGEESPSQVRLRGERLGLKLDNISIFCDTRLEALEEALERLEPRVVVVDSLQTLSSAAVASMQGSPNQVRACCLSLSLLAKKIGAAIFFVGHVTKDGNIAGPKIVEHMVDTVLYFENAEGGVRLLRAAKNRFGSVDEIGLFEMDGKGLHGVKDPTGMFLSAREDGELPPGIVFTSIAEGTRTFVVEIQALVVPAKSGFQRVYSDKIDNARVTRVAAILERHAGLKLSDQDIYVNVAGGVKLSDVSIELPLAIALYSSRLNKSLSSRLVSFGELSLAGEVRYVGFADRRIKAAEELGFERLMTPYEKGRKRPESIMQVRSLKNALKSAVLID